MAKLTGKAKQKARAKKKPSVHVNFVDNMLSTTENVYNLLSLGDTDF